MLTSQRRRPLSDITDHTNATVTPDKFPKDKAVIVSSAHVAIGSPPLPSEVAPSIVTTPHSSVLSQVIGNTPITAVVPSIQSQARAVIGETPTVIRAEAATLSDTVPSCADAVIGETPNAANVHAEQFAVPSLARAVIGETPIVIHAEAAPSSDTVPSCARAVIGQTPIAVNVHAATSAGQFAIPSEARAVIGKTPTEAATSSSDTVPSCARDFIGGTPAANVHAATPEGQFAIPSQARAVIGETPKKPLLRQRGVRKKLKFQSPSSLQLPRASLPSTAERDRVLAAMLAEQGPQVSLPIQPDSKFADIESDQLHVSAAEAEPKSIDAQPVIATLTAIATKLEKTSNSTFYYYFACFFLRYLDNTRLKLRAVQVQKSALSEKTHKPTEYLNCFNQLTHGVVYRDLIATRSRFQLWGHSDTFNKFTGDENRDALNHKLQEKINQLKQETSGAVIKLLICLGFYQKTVRKLNALEWAKYELSQLTTDTEVQAFASRIKDPNRVTTDIEVQALASEIKNPNREEDQAGVKQLFEQRYSSIFNRGTPTRTQKALEAAGRKTAANFRRSMAGG